MRDPRRSIQNDVRFQMDNVIYNNPNTTRTSVILTCCGWRGFHTLRVEQLYYYININLNCRHIAATVEKKLSQKLSRNYACRINTLRGIVIMLYCMSIQYAYVLIQHKW
jgi:hypothetical protein